MSCARTYAVAVARRGRGGDRGGLRDRKRLSGPQMAQGTVTYTCVPYECNWSQDVVNGTVDLVLSLFTHTKAVQTIAVAPKGCWLFL